MPTYEYRCRSCGHTAEEFQKMTEEPHSLCPVCQKSTYQRQISGGIGVQFRGSGFYETDYKKKDPCSSCASQDTCPKKSS